MESKENIEQMVSLYQLTFPTEQESLTSFIQFLHTTNGNNLYDRKNFNGHITASAFVVNETCDKLLLINHKKLNRWLQPGGHVDVEDDTLKQAAMRETTEETGLPFACLTAMMVAGTESIFDIDSHEIPANTNKNEPAHLHHDLRFLFTCSQPAAMLLNTDEATGFKWIPISDLTNDVTFSRIALKLKEVVIAPPNDALAAKLV